MKLHVKCDRCGIYVEGVQENADWRVSLPEGWTHLRFFGEPIRLNQGLPDGDVRAELCPACTKIVEGAAKAAIERRT
jgi:hypothetical protein